MKPAPVQRCRGEDGALTPVRLRLTIFSLKREHVEKGLDCSAEAVRECGYIRSRGCALWSIGWENAPRGGHDRECVLRCRNIEGLLLIAFDQIQTYSTISPFVTRNLPYDRPSETCAQPWSYLLNRQTAQSDPLPILFRLLGIVDPEVAYHSSIVVLRTSYDHERWVPLRFNDSDLVAYNSFVLLLLGKSLVMGQRCH